MSKAESPLVRVLIADDHGLVRRGTRQILEQSDLILVVGEAANGSEAVEETVRLQPDVVLMDIGMPKMNGVEAARQIREQLPEVKVLMLTVHNDVEYVWRAIQVGVSGYILKDTSDAELIRSVLSVAQDNSVLDTKVTQLVLDRLRNQDGDGTTTAAELSRRETEALTLAANGLSNREIGEQLGLSARTIEVHLYNTYRKLGVRSRTEAVVIAIRRGMIPLEPPS